MAGRAAKPFDRFLAERLRFARQVAGMSQRELAAAIGEGVPQLRRYETGEAAISAATLLRIAVAVDASPAWLYGLDDGDHWPDTLLASLFRDPQMPVLVNAFARIADGEARRAVLAVMDEMGSRHHPHPSAPPAAPAVAAPTPGGRPKRALLVDDTPDVLVAAAAFLRSGGYDVVCAQDGRAALDILGGDEPLDVLLTDDAMPGMNGLELVRRAAELRPGLAVVVISTFASGFTFTVGRRPGLVVLAKPFARAELLNAVHAVCARSEAGPPKT